MRCAFANSGERIRLELEREPRCEPNAAQRPESILAHAGMRIADRAHNTALEISATAEWITQLALRRRVRDCIDREVTPGEIIVERNAELDLGVTPVGLHVATERGDLVHDPVIVEHADRAELDPHWNRPLMTEQLTHLIGRRGGRKVPIEVRMPKQGVANRPTNT